MAKTPTERLEAARQIAAEPHLYQICGGCFGISYADVAVCPSCKSYHWDRCPRRIRRHALALARREPTSVTLSDLMG
jgi:hypothetical protein